MLIYPLVLDAEQRVGDVLEMLPPRDDGARSNMVAIRTRARLTTIWYIVTDVDVRLKCDAAAPDMPLGEACDLAGNFYRDVAEVCDVRTLPRPKLEGHGWLVVMSGGRMLGLFPPTFLNAAPSPVPAPVIRPPAPAAFEPPIAPPIGAGVRRPVRRGQRAKPPAMAGPESSGASADEGVGRGGEDEPAESAASEALLAMPRVELPDRCAPGANSHAVLRIGLRVPASPTEAGVMTFVSSRAQKTIEIAVMVEAPDFNCASGWKYSLIIDKADPFTPTLELQLELADAEDTTARVATVRVHYSYLGQPAGMAVRQIALGDATVAEAAAITQPAAAPLQLAVSTTPVDLTIRIARRDQSDTARELVWTLVDCAHPVALPDAPIVHKVGDRDTASSFAAKVTSQVGSADGTVTIDNIMRSIGTLIRRAMPAAALQALNDVAAAVGPSRLTRVLLLTDECHVPWELALLESPPNAARAPYLGAQFAVSRWIHGEDDVPVPPPATLSVTNLAVVLGRYEGSSLAELPHAMEESTELAAEALKGPARFPHVTSVEASADALVDLLNGALPVAGGPIAPELVHFACHGEVLGTGVSKRSVLYLSDGTPLSELLFVSSDLGRNKKSFLFMNACQVGVGGQELGQYAGFPGMAISAGFSGFVGPLWSVNDLIAKGIALDFYRRAFGTDGSAPRAVADVLADMRSQYALEADPKKRQSTWLAYVHYGHPHFTFSHAS